MNIVKKFLEIVLIVCMALSTACSLGNGIKKITLSWFDTGVWEYNYWPH